MNFMETLRAGKLEQGQDPHKLYQDHMADWGRSDSHSNQETWMGMTFPEIQLYYHFPDRLEDIVGQTVDWEQANHEIFEKTHICPLNVGDYVETRGITAVGEVLKEVTKVTKRKDTWMIETSCKGMLTPAYALENYRKFILRTLGNIEFSDHNFQLSVKCEADDFNGEVNTYFVEYHNRRLSVRAWDMWGSAILVLVDIDRSECLDHLNKIGIAPTPQS